MGNLDITQRTQVERTDLLAGGEGIRRGSERGATAYNALAIVVAAVLGFGAFAAIGSWAEWAVLGMIVVTTIGFMIAVSPSRRGV